MSKNTTVPQGPTDTCVLKVDGYGVEVKFDGDGFGLADWLAENDTPQLTPCCKAYTSCDQDGVEYCKGCYQAVTR